MKDPLPTPPDDRSKPLRSSRVISGSQPAHSMRRRLAAPAYCLATLLLCTAGIGCSDSHSDEYVEFADLEPNPGPTEDPAEPFESAVQQVSDGSVTQDNSEVPDSPKPDGDAGAEESTEPVPSAAEQENSEAEAEAEADAEDGAGPGTGPEAASHVNDPFLSEPRKAEDRVGPAGLDRATAKKQEPLPIRLLVPHRQFRKEGESVRATFDDIDLLKVLNMDPVPIDAADHFPDWLQQLNGAQVIIRGYMRPGFEAEDITEFLFVRDNGECCYGPMPKIYDMIAVQLADGESTDLIEGTPFDVKGTFRIEPLADEVELFALFFIDDGVIIQK